MTEQAPEQASRSWIFAFKWSLISFALFVLFLVAGLTHTEWLLLAVGICNVITVSLSWRETKTRLQQAKTVPIPRDLPLAASPRRPWPRCHRPSPRPFTWFAPSNALPAALSGPSDAEPQPQGLCLGTLV
jgi:hypothetical protein